MQVRSREADSRSARFCRIQTTGIFAGQPVRILAFHEPEPPIKIDHSPPTEVEKPDRFGSVPSAMSPAQNLMGTVSGGLESMLLAEDVADDRQRGAMALGPGRYAGRACVDISVCAAPVGECRVRIGACQARLRWFVDDLYYQIA